MSGGGSELLGVHVDVRRTGYLRTAPLPSISRAVVPECRTMAPRAAAHHIRVTKERVFLGEYGVIEEVWEAP